MTTQTVQTNKQVLPAPSGIDPVMRLPAVLATVGMSRGWVLANIKAGNFPAPIKLGAKAIGWRSSVVCEWISSRRGAECNTQVAL